MFNNIRNYCIINDDNNNNNNSKTDRQFRRIIFKIVWKENHRNNDNNHDNNYYNYFNVSSHFQKWEEDYFAEDYWTSKLTVIVKFHNWKP